MNTKRQLARSGKAKGSSLIEMMIAIVVLTVGLVGSMAVASVSISGDARDRKDSTSAAVAEMVAGQISATPVKGSVTSVTVTDCAGNTSTINTSGSTTGEGANLTGTGTIDYTQSFSAVTSGYAMRYTVCGVSNGVQTTYDVRWNIETLASTKEEFVVVGAQFANSSSKNAQVYVPAVNLRTVVGNDGN